MHGPSFVIIQVSIISRACGNPDVGYHFKISQHESSLMDIFFFPLLEKNGPEKRKEII